MFQVGDNVERDIDGMFFEAQVKSVHKPPPRNPDSRGQRRSYSYDVLYPDTKNTELHVPEEEIRLKVGRRRGGSSSKMEDTNSAETLTTSHHYRRPAPDKSTSTVAPNKSAFVLVGDQEHDGVPHTNSIVDEGKRNDPDRRETTAAATTSATSAAVTAGQATAGTASPRRSVHVDPFAATAVEQEHQKKSGKINVHSMDDNERFQSTGSAYITHGQTAQHEKKGAGGGGLRAIRMLRK